jgi:hypothetical protein
VEMDIELMVTEQVEEHPQSLHTIYKVV